MTGTFKRAAERVYTALPVWAQNLAISAWGLRARRQRYGSHFRQTLGFLQQSQWWSQDRLRAYQQERLHVMMEDAYAHVPYWRRVFDAKGVRRSDFGRVDALQMLPLLRKADVVANQDLIWNRRFRRGSLHRLRTSGTTGAPLGVLLSREAIQFQWAVVWRHRGRFGLELGDKFLMFGARLPIPTAEAKMPLWRRNYAFGQVYLSVHHLTPSLIPEVVRWLNEEPFVFYAGYPSGMAVLARHLMQTRAALRIPPRIVVTGSETLLSADADLLAGAFGAPVTELYGMGEHVGGFSRCDRGRLHLDGELGLVELLPVPDLDDPNIRRIVFTGLQNAAMPLFRYDTGDLARVAAGPCDCGRDSVTLMSIDGRLEDCLITPDGRRVSGINQVFKLAEGVQEAQIVQETVDVVRVRIVAAPAYDSHMDSVVKSELHKRLGPLVRIDVEHARELPRTAGGKLRLVVSKVGRDSAGLGVPQKAPL